MPSRSPICAAERDCLIEVGLIGMEVMAVVLIVEVVDELAFELG